MTLVKILYVSRSDGTIETILPKSKKKEGNCPTKEQLEKTKGDNGLYSCYQELAVTDKTHMNWRKKLGDGLVREMRNIVKGQDIEKGKPGKSLRDSRTC